MGAQQQAEQERPAPAWEKVRKWVYTFENSKQTEQVALDHTDKLLPEPDVVLQPYTAHGRSGHRYSYELVRRAINTLWALRWHTPGLSFEAYVVPHYDMPLPVAPEDVVACQPVALVAPRYHPAGEEPPGPKAHVEGIKEMVVDASHTMSVGRWPVRLYLRCPECGGTSEQNPTVACANHPSPVQRNQDAERET